MNHSPTRRHARHLKVEGPANDWGWGPAMEFDAMAGLRTLPRLDFDVRFDHWEETGAYQAINHRSPSTAQIDHLLSHLKSSFVF
jgi:hypothetical protein